MKSPRATKINPACGQRPSGEVLFRSRPRSRRSSNEVAPSAGGGGGARDRRSRFSSSSPVRRGVASAVIVRSRPSFGWGQLRPLGRRPCRCRWALQPGFCIASRGWAQGRIFSVGDSLPSRGGMAKGAKTPWLRSLPTFCRITESKCLPGMRAAKKRVSTGNRSFQRRVWEATSGAAAGELRPFGSR